MTKLRIGIAGFGVVGKRRRKFIDAHPDLTTVAVCDRTFERQQTADDGLDSFSDYRRLLEKELDALFVCMTNDMAAEVTIAGLERGLNVFCEKPPGRDLEDIARVIAVERNRPGQKLMYGFNHRHHDSVRDALELVRSNDLGRIINLRGVYGKSKIINFETDWRTQRAIAGGGILLDQGIHMVDLLRLFAGEFVDVKSFVSNDHWGHDVEDNAYALLRTGDGVVAMLHSSATQWQHRFSLEIALEHGAIILSGLLTSSKSYGAETLTVFNKTPADRGDPEGITTAYDADPSWAAEISDFADAVLNDAPMKFGTSRDAWETMKLVSRIYCADAEWKGRWNLTDDAALPG
ncbi:MAG: Gfo/Idh/MocA family oxidoreductase [Rhodospirillales bacterium]|nr:Gfo/Idh/MocA family oxidoreductase [Rhodospirillales bacterium]